MDWSPEQVSGWLKAKFPADESMRVSHETIYRSLFIQARGVLKKELIGHLRSKRVTRRSRRLRADGQCRGQIVGAVSIRERPAHRLRGLGPGGCNGGNRQRRFARLEFFERELELRDLRIELLRGAPELHPSQLRQLQLQLLDLQIPRQQQRLLLAHQALQAVEVVGQIGVAWHACILPAARTRCTRKCLKYRHLRIT